mmetsp:Transcript_8712/g.13362  ORF Transcript_8712/g.13362 Transcript_8712/m.13362 type:complete len:245 (-) Transcript_8712:1320-2054(-)
MSFSIHRGTEPQPSTNLMRRMGVKFLKKLNEFLQTNLDITILIECFDDFTDLIDAKTNIECIQGLLEFPNRDCTTSIFIKHLKKRMCTLFQREIICHHVLLVPINEFIPCNITISVSIQRGSQIGSQGCTKLRHEFFQLNFCHSSIRIAVKCIIRLSDLFNLYVINFMAGSRWLLCTRLCKAMHFLEHQKSAYNSRRFFFTNNGSFKVWISEVTDTPNDSQRCHKMFYIADHENDRDDRKNSVN